ncbi:MAG: helix-turn-helix domain-containing protein [Rhizobiaceae bacterium]
MVVHSELPASFTEMLRSFVVLARSLNLSQTVETLGVTRQTVRRHLSALEELRGEKLLILDAQRYKLTDAGETSLRMAENLLRQSRRWAGSNAGQLGGLSHAAVRDSDGGWFYAQQHPLNDVWSLAPPLLVVGLEAWANCRGQLESEALTSIRPYMIVYRRRAGEWLCVEVGEKSSFATWLGWTWAKSAIGIPVYDDPVHSDADQFLIEPFDHVSVFGGVWYDHVSTRFPREREGNPIPANYQRLVFATAFPDGSQAVVVLVARTNSLTIEGIDTSTILQTPAELLMEEDIST